jgi:ZIP family zinc transporter
MTSEVFMGIMIPFIGTSLGAAMVFFLKKQISENLQKILTGFAAGAMMYVVVEELIPEMSEGKHTNVGTVAFAFGFVLMMILDVALG